MKISISAAAKPIEYQLLDALKLWMFYPAGKDMAKRNAAFAAMSKLSAKLPAELREAPTTLYRALVLNKALTAELTSRLKDSPEASEVVLKLELRKMSSWTTSKAFAIEFSENFVWTGRALDTPVILKREIDPSLVVLNIPVAYKWLLKQVKKAEILEYLGGRGDKILNWLSTEKEIIVKNTKDLQNVKASDILSVNAASTKTILKEAKVSKTAAAKEKPVEVLEYIKKQLKVLSKTYKFSATVSPSNLGSSKPAATILRVFMHGTTTSASVSWYARGARLPVLLATAPRLKIERLPMAVTREGADKILHIIARAFKAASKA